MLLPAFPASPVQRVQLPYGQCWVKRDDLLHPIFNGNKARKFAYYLHQLPDSSVKKISSYGGNQSNAMRALAALAQLKNWQFDYYTPPLPRWLRAQPQGNLAAALKNGMQLHEITGQYKHTHDANDCLFIPQGGAEAHAAYGLQQLATELINFIRQQQLNQAAIFLPSGTGTSALYLQQALDIPVFTTPCVGDGAYLQQQFKALLPNTSRFPQIVDGDQKKTFASLHLPWFQLWQELRHHTGIEFDLLYDPKAWQSIKTHNLLQKWDLIYVHCGGIEGNQTMINRYQRKYTIMQAN